MVGLHLKKHGGSAAKSLAALPAASSTQRSLAGLDDPELAASLAGLPGIGAGHDSGGQRTLDVDLGPTAADGSVLAGLGAEMGKISHVVLHDTEPVGRPSAPDGGDGESLSPSRPGGISSSARSPAAAWARSTAAATSTLAATWH